MFLSNVTRDGAAARAVADATVGEGDAAAPALPRVCDAFCRGPAFNPKGTFHHLGNVFFNICQTVRTPVRPAPAPGRLNTTRSRAARGSCSRQAKGACCSGCCPLRSRWPHLGPSTDGAE